ncbi:MAG: hypothetical protein HC942_21160 [Microcoleus sp. SU_5_6]|nr:hypothetical protein [Microcoleus sp. SU_5_6]NJL69762.1 hypothetical protein [Microcoleus sp. SM1_3_4]
MVFATVVTCFLTASQKPSHQLSTLRPTDYASGQAVHYQLSTVNCQRSTIYGEA